MAGRLYRMAKVVSANPASWGIVDANQISGFRTVATQADLYSIAACILSSSYGDGTTTGADAVGQIWHVQDTNKDFRLTSWANRGKAAGWAEELTSAKLSEDITNATKTANVAQETATAAGKAASAAQATANAAKSQATTAEGIAEKNKKSITVLQNTVNTINTTVSGHTQNIADLTAFKTTKGQPNGLAPLDANENVPLKNLGNLDTTLFEVVSELPSTIATIKKHIYLKAAGITGDKNNYAEYIYTGDLTAAYDATKWEKLGEITASVDLSGYYTKSQTNDAIDSHRIDTIKFVNEQVVGSTNLQLGLMEKGGTTIGPETIPEVTSDLNGLMTPALKAKLDGIATGANNYVHPTRFDGAIAIGKIYKFNTDKFGHIGAATPVSKGDITALGIPGETPALAMSAISDTESVIVRAMYGGNNYDATISSADANNAGVMSVAAWTKLSGIAEGATKNVIDPTLTATGTNAVQGKVIYDAINTHKITSDNLSPATGTTYSIIGENDSEINEVSALTDSLMYQYSSTDHSTLTIDGAAVWDEYTLKAISNTELTEILV